MRGEENATSMTSDASRKFGESTAPPAEWSAPAQPSQHPLIFERLAAVAKSVAPVGKDGKNRDQHYEFRRAEDVLAAVKAALDRHGVVTTHRIVEYQRTDFKTQRGGTGYCVLLKQVTVFSAPDGSSVETESWGEAMDYSDKATNKAMTQATKYTYVRTFNIAEAGLDIADAESPQAAGPSPSERKARAKRTSKARKTTDVFGTVQTWREKLRTAADEQALRMAWTAFAAVREHFSAQDLAVLASIKDRRKAALADEITCTHDETEKDPDGNTVCLGCDALVRAASTAEQALGDDDLPEGF
jgi:hypothetical protein